MSLGALTLTAVVLAGLIVLGICVDIFRDRARQEEEQDRQQMKRALRRYKDAA